MPNSVCPICSQPRSPEPGPCSQCGATAAWAELAEAHEFARRRFVDWCQQGRIGADHLATIEGHYQRRRGEMRDAIRAGGGSFTGSTLPSALQCFSCFAFMEQPQDYCDSCGVKLKGPGILSLRSWLFLGSELRSLGESGQVPLVLAHKLENEVRERIAALTRRLEQDRELLQAKIVEPPPISEQEPRSVRRRELKTPSRPLLEVLLDPHSIQLLLAAGGGLLVLGIVIWLSSLGLFENSGFVAVGLGLGNVGLVAAGWALLKWTRYQMAGRSLTLLACLVMPLNLWFYHTHGLITLDGHLWVAALICCGVYAASAILLRDPLFVYVLCGGLTLTGLLLLADLGRFAEIFAPSLLLMILAQIALHLEIAFPSGEGPFARKSFGKAFFFSAQVLLAASLGLLLGGQLTAWLHGPIFRAWAANPPVVGQHDYLPWTILLTLAGTYAYVYSDLMVRHKGVYVYFAAATLLWAEVQFLVLLNLTDAEPIILLTLSLTALLVNAFHHFMRRDDRVTHALPPLGLILAAVPVMFAVVLHFRATFGVARQAAWAYDITWGHVFALAATAGVCRLSAYWTRASNPGISTTYFFGTAVATLVAAAGLAWKIGLHPWEMQAPFLMLIPIAYIIASWLYRGHSPEQPLAWVAQASTAFMIACSFGVWIGAMPRAAEPVIGARLNLLLALFALEGAVFYALAAASRREAWNVYMGTAMMCGCLWQLLSYFGAPDAVYPLTFAGAGTVLLLAYRFAVLDRVNLSRMADAAFQSANGLMSLGFLAGVLLSLSRLVMNEGQLRILNLPGDDWTGPIKTLIVVLSLLLTMTLIGCMVVAHAGWRRWYVVLAIIESILLMLAIYKVINFSPWQQLELIGIVLGIIFLGLGHFGWAKEDDLQSEWVTFCLFFGSLLVLVPLFIATCIYRFGFEISPLNELGLVFASVLLIGSGILCRLKSTTILGTIALGLYILIMLIDLHRALKHQVLVGIYLTLGGGLLFGTGLMLSVFRDRLLALPDKIKRREGLFRILTWR